MTTNLITKLSKSFVLAPTICPHCGMSPEQDRTVFVAVGGVKQPLLNSFEREVLDEDADEGITPVVFVDVEKK
jgi:hypothetical protein